MKMKPVMTGELPFLSFTVLECKIFNRVEGKENGEGFLGIIFSVFYLLCELSLFTLQLTVIKLNVWLNFSTFFIIFLEEIKTHRL